MKKIFAFFFLLLSLGACAQAEIKLDQVKNHVGDSVKVRGKIFGVRFLETATNKPTFINIGAAYPDQVLTVLIPFETRKILGYKPEDKKFEHGMAVVTGKVELYKGKPQIIIKDPNQLAIIYDEEVSPDQLPPIGQ